MDYFLRIFVLLMWQILLLVVHSEQVAVSKERLKGLSTDGSAKNARYYFSANVDDEKGNLMSHRKEVRFGPQVNGSFSYNDGFVIREIIYTADSTGYRILSDKMKQLHENTQEKSTSQKKSY